MTEPNSPASILQNAIEISDPRERDAYLASACGSDSALRGEVESLLDAHSDAETFMETPTDPTRDSGREPPEFESIGPYKLLLRIGEGGFGTVYLAEQFEPVRRRVALKVIKPGMDSKEVIARFDVERQALAIMDHPNIARIYGAGTTENGRPYFVMELVNGTPITQFCDDQRYDPRRRLELFLDVCSAVHHAHQKGIIHRDLKPSNVMVTLAGDQPVVKVIDFGIAKATRGRLTDRTLFTQFEQFMGTPAYMSPEQAAASSIDVDTRSDIYSLGVLLYELLAGAPPFDQKSLLSAGYDEMRRIIAEEEPPKPSTRCTETRAGTSTATGTISESAPEKLSISAASLRGELDWIVMKAIEKDRSLRYETANAFAADIGRFLVDEPVLAAAPSAAYRCRKFAKRNRRILLSSAAALLALLAGLAVAGGVWFKGAMKQSERMAVVEGRASTLAARAEQLMERNAEADYHEVSHFREARSLAEQLENLVEIEETGEEVRSRCDRIMSMVSSEAQERDLILGIEETLMMRMSEITASRASVGAGIAEAFGRHDVDPIGSPPEETIAWIESRRDGVRSKILAGLLEWAKELGAGAPDDAGKLAAIVESADPDPWRRRLRKAMVEKDRPVLEQLASSEESGQQQIMTILNLAVALRAVDATAAAEQLLRRLQWERPGSFWSNFALGSVLHGSHASRVGASVSAPRRGSRLEITTYSFEQSEGVKRKRQFDESAGFLRAAMAIRPNAAGGWVTLSRSLLDAGRVEEAVVAARRAVELKPGIFAAHLNLGNCLHKRGDLDGAIEAHRKAIELNPDFPGSYVNLGGCLDEKGETEEAVVSYRKAIELDPGMAVAYSNLGLAYLELGELDEAVASYRKAVELDQGIAIAHANLGGALAEQGKIAAAIECLEEAAKLDPSDALSYLNLGHIHSNQGNSGDAIASYRKAIRVEPDSPEGYFHLGEALFDEDKLDESIAAYHMSIERDPRRAITYTSLGKTLTVQGEFDEALASHNKAIELDPELAIAHNNLGFLLWRQGKLRDSAVACRRALELAPDMASAHSNLGRVLRDQGELDAAAASLRTAIKLDPDCSLIHGTLGTVLQLQGMAGEAIVSYRRQVDLDPDSALPKLALGAALVEQGELEEGINHLRKGVELDQDSAMAHFGLGHALWMQGNLDRAIESFRRAIDLDPDLSQAHMKLAAALLVQGKFGEAEMSLRDHLQENPNPGMSFQLKTILGMEAEIFAVLCTKGVDHPEVAALVHKLSAGIPFLPPSSDVVRVFWEEHPGEVAKALGTAKVRVIMRRKAAPPGGAPERNDETEKRLFEELRKKLAGGADFVELAHTYSDGLSTEADRQGQLQKGCLQTVKRTSDLVPELVLAAITLEEGAVSGVIETRQARFLLKVETRELGEADRFDRPGVKEAVEALFTHHRRKQWEEDHLARLKKRIKE